MHEIVFAIYPGIQALDVVGPYEVFDAANQLLGSEAYQITVAAVDAGTTAGGSGLRIGVDTRLDQIERDIGTLVVAGGYGRSGLPEPPSGLYDEVRRLSALAERVTSVCTGALVLAEAGLLDGRRATTHWSQCTLLAQRYPSVEVDPDRVFVRDGNVSTSAGVTAGIDLALALVEEDHGPDLARRVAKWLVVFLQRPGGQSQFSSRTRISPPPTSPIREAVDEVVADPSKNHTVEAMAHRVGMSPRNFARVFRSETGMTPGSYVESVRVEAAQQTLESTDLDLRSVARRCGFGHEETLRKAFHRRLGVSPGEYRSRFGSRVGG